MSGDLTADEFDALYSPIGNDTAYPELPGVVADMIAARVAEVIKAVEAIYPPYNYELRYDGTEDPTAAAYVDAFREVDRVLEPFRAAVAHVEGNGETGV